jgi:hypothetical protein
MRLLIAAVSCVLLLPQASPGGRVRFSSAAADYAVLRFQVDDAAATVAAAALDLLIDGRKDQSVVLTPGVQRTSYEALLGPLPAGAHDVRLEPSSLWTWDPSLRPKNVAVDVVSGDAARSAIFRHAPAIGLRPDTIGTASDLPLMMYVEDVKENGTRWLKYSAIFSNEDGGTPGAALMARWGRTTDIELAYEVELRGGQAVQGRYQGPDHRVIPKSQLEVLPPLLLVSTLNNMFLDRGHAAVVVRMVPEVLDLSTRSRESVMDERPWMYRVMARELAQERPVGVGDPRDYLYVDLKLEGRAAGIALGARSADGTTRWSDRGRPELVVSRQGELRIAIPSPRSEAAVALTVRCDPRPDSASPVEAARCAVEMRKAFRLDANHEPGPNVIQPVRLTLDPGIGREIPIAADKIKR